MRASTCLAAIILTGPAQALAQDPASADEICAASEAHYAAIRAGEMAEVVDQHTPDFTFFMGDGSLLWSFDSHERQTAEFSLDPTFASQTYLRHCSAQVFGDTGIATFYLTGAVTIGGDTQTGTWRVTEVWVREGNEWKEAHHHESPLLGSVRP